MVVPNTSRPAGADALFTLKFRPNGVPSVLEGPAGTTREMKFTVRLSQQATQPVTYSYATSDGTAVAPVDYRAKTGSKTIAVGKEYSVFSVVVKGDDVSEGNESFFVTLTGVVGATLTPVTQTLGTIRDDDPLRVGRTIGWGSSAGGATAVPSSAEFVTAIAAGHDFGLALRADGRVVGWGDNTFGQTTIPVDAESGVSAIAAGSDFGLALKGGRIIAWGNNDFGQTTVNGASLVTAIAAAGHHGLAIRERGPWGAGDVLAWGENDFRQATVPTVARSGVTAVAAGLSHSLALKGSQVIAWGRDNFGQTTVPLDAESGIEAVAAGDGHSLALKGDRVIAWGNNDMGQTTVPVDAESGVTAIAAGGRHSLALKNGRVIEWGETSVPVPVDAQSGVVSLAAGGTFSLAVTQTGP